MEEKLLIELIRRFLELCDHELKKGKITELEYVSMTKRKKEFLKYIGA